MKKVEKKPKNSRIKSFLSFIFLWIATTAILLSVLYFAGLMPGYVKEFASDALASVGGNASNSSSVTLNLPAFPKNGSFIYIPKINLISAIVFPTSTDLAVLDKALYGGVAHYPGSALPGEAGNVFIFGHSSSRLFVRNKAWTAFTNVHNLQTGDDIYIISKGANYHYRISEVKLAVDPKTGSVPLKSDKPILTLSTCWPIGNPKDRTVVVADLVDKIAMK